MIKEEELRQGNWVFDECGVCKQIDYRDGDWFHAELFEPILLTFEILDRYAFKNRSESSDYCFELPGFIIGGTCRRLFLSIWGESGLEGIGNEIKYVHQLQNIYYDLYGCELCIIAPIPETTRSQTQQAPR